VLHHRLSTAPVSTTLPFTRNQVHHRLGLLTSHSTADHRPLATLAGWADGEKNNPVL
jgi:hypothetical protein